MTHNLYQHVEVVVEDIVEDILYGKVIVVRYLRLKSNEFVSFQLTVQ